VQKRLKFDFSLPGQPGYETAVRIRHLYGSGGDTPPSIVVVTAPPGQTVASNAGAIATAFDSVRVEEPALRVIDLGVTRDAHFVTNDARSTFALVFSPPASSFGADKRVDAAKTIVARALPRYHVGLTGLSQLSTGSQTKGP